MKLEDLSTAALLEQYAEECVEAAHAALKYARVLRGENPTPKKADDCVAALKEEMADVYLAGMEVRLRMNYTSDQMEFICMSKRTRWVNRLNGKA